LKIVNNNQLFLFIILVMTNQKVENVKRRTFNIIQIGKSFDIPSRIFDFFIAFNIILNIAVTIMLTFDSLSKYYPLLEKIELITIIIFIIEYILRLWTATYLYPGKKTIPAIIDFIFSYDGIVDLLTILPFFFLSGFVALRMLRVVRILHLFRINNSYDSFHVISSVLVEKKNQLLSSVFILLVLMLAASMCMYSAEHEAQPEIFKNAFSGIWWAVSTLSTVGYGDIYPITMLGKFLAIVISFLGIGVVAIPTGIISAGFVEQYSKMSNSAEALNVHFLTVVIDIDSKWIGKTVKEVEKEFDIMIVVVQRDRVTFVPNEEYIVQLEDVMVVYHKPDDMQ